MSDYRTNIADNAAPLTGVRVLDLAPGPMAAITKLLGDLGAEVIRVEPEGGAADRRCEPLVAGVGITFAVHNRGKRATTDERFDSLAADADIVVADRDRIDLVALRTRYPALVAMAVSPFGDTPGYRDWLGTEAVYHALSGELARSGLPGRPPLLPPGELAHGCAAAQAAFVLLLAYYNRLRTGIGDLLDFSILDGVAQALDPGYGAGGSATLGVPAAEMPRGRGIDEDRYPIYSCKDGHVRVCVLSLRQWRCLFDWMGRPAAFADPWFDQLLNRRAHAGFGAAVAAFFAAKTCAEAEAEAASRGVPVATVRNLAQATVTEQIVARKAFVDREIAPGIDAPFANGVLKIDGRRMAQTNSPPAIDDRVGWTSAPPPPAPWADDRAKSGVPLEGLRILDLGAIVVGNESGRLLADAGADVIKIEAAAFPDGNRLNRTAERISANFAAGNRNKRGLGLNLRHEEGKALLLRLVKQSDVLLSNFKGGTLEALGLDYASLAAINPGIIVIDSSAYGSSGPWSSRPGYGPLVRASAGLTDLWRYSGDAAGFCDAITVYPDHAAARVGTIGVIALLIRRLRTARGGSVCIAQIEVMLNHIGGRIAATALAEARQPVVGAETETLSKVLACAGDDEWCVVTVRDDDDRRKIAAITDGHDLAEWLATQAPHEAATALQAAGVAAAPMLRVGELPTYDYYLNRAFFRRHSHPHLSYAPIMEARPVRARRLFDPPDRPAPLPGEHTDLLMSERLGLSNEAVDRLVAAGTLERPPSA